MTTENRHLAGGGSDPERVFRAIVLPESHDSASTLDLAAILRFWRSYWLLICSSAIIGGVATFALSFAFAPKYRAEVLLAPTESASDSGGLQGLLGQYSALAKVAGVGIPGGGGMVPVAVARLQSRGFIESFIADENVMSVLYPDDAPPRAGEKAAADSRRTLQDAYRRFTRSIMLVKHDEDADLVTIRIDWEDRELAARWANILVHRLNAAMRADAIADTELSLKYLETELHKASYTTLKDSISSLMEAQINKRMLAITQPDYVFRVLDPAKPSDKNKKVAPKRSLFLALGVLLGGFIGVLWGLSRRSNIWAESASVPASRS